MEKRDDPLWDEEVFYHNRVISGGIEWNCGPTGHTVTSFSPVDVVVVANPDGSASLVAQKLSRADERVCVPYIEVQSSAARAAWTECASNFPLTDEQTRFIGECQESLAR